jgi:hypothetical protein
MAKRQSKEASNRDESKKVLTSELALHGRGEAHLEVQESKPSALESKPANAGLDSQQALNPSTRSGWHLERANVADVANSTFGSSDSRTWATTNVASAQSQVADRSENDLHEILANDLAAWSQQMYINIYEDAPISSPSIHDPWSIGLNSRRPDIQSEPKRSNEQFDSQFNVLSNVARASNSYSSSSFHASDNLAMPPIQYSPAHDLMAFKKGRQPSESGSETPPISLGDEPEDRCKTFPVKLHKLLTDLEAQEGGKEIASFLPHGRSFRVYKPEEFATIMKDYFHMTVFSSFQRQLLLYKFKRIKQGRDKGAYFHEFFQRGNPTMCTYMRPMKTSRKSQPSEKET